MAPGWWRRRTGYQVWPRSFCDFDGDGIGDLPGIVSKLDHLADLGVGFIWLSPVYDSPMADMGYDISDYRAIWPPFGTMADMDRLIGEAAVRDMGVVMDLVVNHTSDRHPWFLEARTDRTAPRRDWYVWRDPAPDGGPPDDRQSYFGGPGWRLAPETGQYYLALFTPAQPDLNWECAAMRAAVWDMMRWWLDRGVAGFRMDVIDHIGKDVDAGLIENGPRLHDHLREMHREVLAGRNVLTVGEAWSAEPADAVPYTGRDRGELDMLFQFRHVTEGWDPVQGKWRPRPHDPAALRRVLYSWQRATAEDGWTALFLGNHDLPRMVSRYGDPVAHRVRSAKALTLALHGLRGTPFVYQGDEFGMVNGRFDRIEEFRDVETLTHHRLAMEAGMAEAEFIAGANTNGRDTGRTPVQWTDGPGAGFTNGTPWIGLTPANAHISAEADAADANGLIAFHRRLIVLRRDMAILTDGRFAAHAEDHTSVWIYERRLGGERLLIAANLTGTEAQLDMPPDATIAGRPLLWTVAPRDRLEGTVTLAPWEAVAIHALD
ncbi:alpha-glucosidase [Rhodobacteraceae bacterium CCMM004]|nr:alpha-glucosidase [Rhodobacteraceae bacterium CCMM004]